MTSNILLLLAVNTNVLEQKYSQKYSNENKMYKLQLLRIIILTIW